MAAAIRDVPITVQSANLQLGTAWSARVRTSVIRISTKYFGRLNGASVYLRREGKSYRCNIDMGAFNIVSSEESSFNCYFAFIGH
jgi:hypothetical protein